MDIIELAIVFVVGYFAGYGLFHTWLEDNGKRKESKDIMKGLRNPTWKERINKK